MAGRLRSGAPVPCRRRSLSSSRTTTATSLLTRPYRALSPAEAGQWATRQPMVGAALPTARLCPPQTAPVQSAPRDPVQGSLSLQLPHVGLGELDEFRS